MILVLARKLVILELSHHRSPGELYFGSRLICIIDWRSNTFNSCVGLQGSLMTVAQTPSTAVWVYRILSWLSLKHLQQLCGFTGFSPDCRSNTFNSCVGLQDSLLTVAQTPSTAVWVYRILSWLALKHLQQLCGFTGLYPDWRSNTFNSCVGLQDSILTGAQTPSTVVWVYRTLSWLALKHLQQLCGFTGFSHDWRSNTFNSCVGLQDSILTGAQTPSTAVWVYRILSWLALKHLQQLCGFTGFSPDWRSNTFNSCVGLQSSLMTGAQTPSTAVWIYRILSWLALKHLQQLCGFTGLYPDWRSNTFNSCVGLQSSLMTGAQTPSTVVWVYRVLSWLALKHLQQLCGFTEFSHDWRSNTFNSCVGLQSSLMTGAQTPSTAVWVYRVLSWLALKHLQQLCGFTEFSRDWRSNTFNNCVGLHDSLLTGAQTPSTAVWIYRILSWLSLKHLQQLCGFEGLSPDWRSNTFNSCVGLQSSLMTVAQTPSTAVWVYRILSWLSLKHL